LTGSYTITFNSGPTGSLNILSRKSSSSSESLVQDGTTDFEAAADAEATGTNPADAEATGTNPADAEATGTKHADAEATGTNPADAEATGTNDVEVSATAEVGACRC